MDKREVVLAILVFIASDFLPKNVKSWSLFQNFFAVRMLRRQVDMQVLRMKADESQWRAKWDIRVLRKGKMYWSWNVCRELQTERILSMNLVSCLKIP